MTDHRELDNPVRRQRLARWAGPAAVLLSGLVIALAVDMGASRLADQRFQVAGDARSVWRLDTRTGQLVRCTGPVGDRGFVRLAAAAPVLSPTRPADREPEPQPQTQPQPQPQTQPQPQPEAEPGTGEQRGSSFPFPLPHPADGRQPAPEAEPPAAEPAPEGDAEQGQRGPFGLPFRFGSGDDPRTETPASDPASTTAPPATGRPANAEPQTRPTPARGEARVTCEVVEADALRRR